MDRQMGKVTQLQIQVKDQRGCHYGSPLQEVCHE